MELKIEPGQSMFYLVRNDKSRTLSRGMMCSGIVICWRMLPSRVMVVADQEQYSNWIHSLINYQKDSPYAILVLGGKCPEGFTQLVGLYFAGK